MMKSILMVTTAVVASVSANPSSTKLLQAVDAALMRSVDDYSYHGLMEQLSPDINIFPGDCYPADSVDQDYAYPTVDLNDAATDSLAAVLTSGVVNVAAPAGDSTYATIMPAFGPFPAQAQGIAVDLFNKIFSDIQAHYAVDHPTIAPEITIAFNVVFGNDRSFDSLNTGVVDLIAPFAAVGGKSDTLDRTQTFRRREAFARSCGVFSSELFIVTRAGEYPKLNDMRNSGKAVCAFINLNGIVGSIFANGVNELWFGNQPPTPTTPDNVNTYCIDALLTGTPDGFGPRGPIPGRDSSDFGAYLTDQPIELLEAFLATNYPGETFDIKPTGLAPATAFWGRKD